MVTAGDAPAPLPRKVKAYKVLGDVGEFQEKLASTLPPPKPPPAPDVFSVTDVSEFPPEVWFAATISPDNGVAFIRSYRELCQARALYQQQLNNIHTARKAHGMGASATALPPPTQTLQPSTVFPPLAGEPLANRTIAEALKFGAETRRLGKFEQQQAKWEGVQSGLASKVGRPTTELAMARGPAWRTRGELTELLYRAQPRDARGLNPDEVWTASLRDAWERILPLGSIFSGLAIKIHERPHELPATRAARVGRPLDPLGPPGSSLRLPVHPPTMLPGGGSMTGLRGKPPLGRSLSARGRAWEDGEVLRQRVAEYGTRLRSLAPHDPDFGSLVVAGEALEGQLAALAHAPITLQEVEGHVAGHAPESFEAYRAVKDEMEAQLRAALEAEEAARAAEEAAARALAPLPGPHVALSSPLLSLGCHTGDTARGAVTLRSTGTAALAWAWRRRPAPQHAHAATELAQPPRFVASLQSGVLQPGQSLEVAVTFEARVAGTFRETWELVTEPPLQAPIPSLQLRGQAELRDPSAPGRAALVSQLGEREKAALVAAALERVLRDVRMPRRPVPSEPPEESMAADAWDRANGCTSEGGAYTWPPLFHSPGVQAELSEVYAEANAALTLALKPPADEDAKRKKKPPVSPRGKKKPGAEEEPPPPPPKYPAAWPDTGPSLSVLDALLAELAAAAPAVAPALAARADAAKARARVPSSNRKVVRRAMRVLVGRLVDSLEDRFNAIRLDLEAKQAAEAAAAGGGANAAAGDGEGEGEADGEASAGSVGGGKEAKAGAKDGGKADKPKGAKAGGKGGKGGKGGDATASGEAAAPPEPGAGLPSVEHLQPLFHEKALTATKAVVKTSLNSLSDEVVRHKVAAGDALEATIRSLDEQVAAEQARVASVQAEGGEADPGAAAAAAAAAALAAFLAPPAGGVPAVGPGEAASVRSPLLEELYWERLCVLRTWTGLGIPTRADIR
ncbi:hypothetical protein HYH03_015243 [Edaphochlamys debaryana]|uniref:Uncharacterized protein n=1 Tax=Edaphochlamys debaryana TaxID=47281 RepID=A0A835XPR2_9CHLO|nr:hypothetical protein HYH03_015243 [Edaphochlamys debaryana]|eukprot:KAG2486036.1 hypothetical protein HYH03_015243 [Edaphochlamys debaryana]